MIQFCDLLLTFFIILYIVDIINYFQGKHINTDNIKLNNENLFWFKLITKLSVIAGI